MAGFEAVLFNHTRSVPQHTLKNMPNLGRALRIRVSSWFAGSANDRGLSLVWVNGNAVCHHTLGAHPQALVCICVFTAHHHMMLQCGQALATPDAVGAAL